MRLDVYKHYRLRVRDLLTKEVLGMVYDSSPLSRAKLRHSLIDLYYIVIRNYDQVFVGTKLANGK